jgi:hypothetical protein
MSTLLYSVEDYDLILSVGKDYCSSANEWMETECTAWVWWARYWSGSMIARGSKKCYPYRCDFQRTLASIENRFPMERVDHER